ncbi:hypothetical protein [Aerococcus urinae]|uniref:hypothetical protein n=1 Tax=Aerococcus urinae TaxID=1376 RepID=UPI00254D4DC9|nr:hypothetical protein [Aerococcus urinae]
MEFFEATSRLAYELNYRVRQAHQRARSLEGNVVKILKKRMRGRRRRLESLEENTTSTGNCALEFSEVTSRLAYELN